MPDLFLHSAGTIPNDLLLFDPTAASGGIVTTLIANTIAFALAGNAARLNTLLSGGVGVYAETGRSVPLQAVLLPITGTYILTGYAVSNAAAEVRQFLLTLGVR